MKIIINTATLRFGGAVHGALSLINECKYFTENEYHVFVGKGVQKSLKREHFPDNFYFYDFDWGAISIWKIPAIAKALRKLESEINPDCVITTSGPSYWTSKAPHLMGYNLGLYIYEESPFMQLISAYRKARWYIKRKIHFYLFKRDAWAYYVQTDDVNRRIRKVFNTDKVFTVSNTHSSYFVNSQVKEKKLPVKNNGEIRLLTISSYYKHKNLELIPLVSEELSKRGYNHVKFIMTIDAANFERMCSNYPNVINVGSVKPEECASLYNECDFMFLPTLAECFSASYPEAMVMKKPIITTDLSFAKDICRNAAVFFEALNPKSAADRVELLINSESLQQELIENGLKRVGQFNNPRERAGKILDICSGLMAN